MEENQETQGKWRRFKTTFFAISDRCIDAGEDYLRIIIREVELFLGLALVFIGLLHFRTGKFCDGNTADYLSCTRPSPYHYYGALEIFLVVAGIFFITLWFFKRAKKRSA